MTIQNPPLLRHEELQHYKTFSYIDTFTMFAKGKYCEITSPVSQRTSVGDR